MSFHPTASCAQLNIFNFHYYVNNNIKAASSLIDLYQKILNSSGRSEHISRLLSNNIISLNDSVYIYAEDSSELVIELSFFIKECFKYSFEQYHDSLDTEHDTLINTLHITDSSNSSEQEWSPLLFSGVIGLCNIKTIDCSEYQDKRVNYFPVVDNTSYINLSKIRAAKHFEPSILCDKNFYDTLSSRAKLFVHPTTDNNDYFEINWTSICYIQYFDEILNKNVLDKNVNSIDEFLEKALFIDLLIPATSLWKEYNHLDISNSYFNFLRLIIKGVRNFFVDTTFKDYVDEKVINYLYLLELNNKTKDLLKN